MCKDCGRLHEELRKRNEEMYGLRQQITRLETGIRKERSDKRKLVKEKKNGWPPNRKRSERYLPV